MIVGCCSLCGGIVKLPDVWFGTDSPVPRCQNCGAVKDTKTLPIIPMKAVTKQALPKF